MKALYERKKHVIRKISNNKIIFIGKRDVSHITGIKGDKTPCINAAKKESIKLQLANGGLGLGSLVVIA